MFYQYTFCIDESTFCLHENHFCIDKKKAIRQPFYIKMD